MKLEGVNGPLIHELRAAGAKILSERVTCIVFYIACCIWLAYSVISTSYLYTLVLSFVPIGPQEVYYYIVLLVSICELGVVLREGYTAKDAYALIILFIMCQSSLVNSFPLILYSVILVFCARKYDIKKTITLCAIIVGIVALIIFSCSSFGIIHDTVFGDDNLNKIARIRHCLGFIYTLFPSQYLFCLTCVICYLRNKKLTIIEGIALLAINLLMYRLTKSRLSFILGSGLVVLVFMLRVPWITNKLFQRIRRLLVWSFPLAFVISVGFTLLYGILHPYEYDVLEGMNVTFGGRLALGFNGLMTIGFKMLGQNVAWQGSGLDMNGYNSHSVPTNYVDNFFLHVLLEEGWVYMIGIIILLTVVSKRAYDEGDDVLLLALAVTAAHLMVDDLAMYLHYNLLYFLIAGIYLGNGSKRVAEEAAVVGDSSQPFDS